MPRAHPRALRARTASRCHRSELIVLGTTELIHNRVARGEAEQLMDLLPQLRQLWFTTVAEHREPAAAEPIPA
jgi:hypothetical protein